MCAYQQQRPPMRYEDDYYDGPYQEGYGRPPGKRDYHQDYGERDYPEKLGEPGGGDYGYGKGRGEPYGEQHDRYQWSPKSAAGGPPPKIALPPPTRSAMASPPTRSALPPRPGLPSKSGLLPNPDRDRYAHPRNDGLRRNYDEPVDYDDSYLKRGPPDYHDEFNPLPNAKRRPLHPDYTPERGEFSCLPPPEREGFSRPPPSEREGFSRPPLKKHGIHDYPFRDPHYDDPPLGHPLEDSSYDYEHLPPDRRIPLRGRPPGQDFRSSDSNRFGSHRDFDNEYSTERPDYGESLKDQGKDALFENPGVTSRPEDTFRVLDRKQENSDKGSKPVSLMDLNFEEPAPMKPTEGGIGMAGAPGGMNSNPSTEAVKPPSLLDINVNKPIGQSEDATLAKQRSTGFGRQFDKLDNQSMDYLNGPSQPKFGDGLNREQFGKTEVGFGPEEPHDRWYPEEDNFRESFDRNSKFDSGDNYDGHLKFHDRRRDDYDDSFGKKVHESEETRWGASSEERPFDLQSKFDDQFSRDFKHKEKIMHEEYDNSFSKKAYESENTLSSFEERPFDYQSKFDDQFSSEFKPKEKIVHDYNFQDVDLDKKKEDLLRDVGHRDEQLMASRPDNKAYMYQMLDEMKLKIKCESSNAITKQIGATASSLPQQQIASTSRSLPQQQVSSITMTGSNDTIAQALPQITGTPPDPLIKSIATAPWNVPSIGGPAPVPAPNIHSLSSITTSVPQPVPSPFLSQITGPVPTPVPAPVVAPFPAPVAAPVPTPVPAPVPAPVPSPVPAPVPPPIPMPVPPPVPASVPAPVPAPATKSRFASANPTSVLQHSAPAVPATIPAPATAVPFRIGDRIVPVTYSSVSAPSSTSNVAPPVSVPPALSTQYTGPASVPFAVSYPTLYSRVPTTEDALAGFSHSRNTLAVASKTKELSQAQKAWIKKQMPREIAKEIKDSNKPSKPPSLFTLKIDKSSISKHLLKDGNTLEEEVEKQSPQRYDKMQSPQRYDKMPSIQIYDKSKYSWRKDSSEEPTINASRSAATQPNVVKDSTNASQGCNTTQPYIPKRLQSTKSGQASTQQGIEDLKPYIPKRYQPKETPQPESNPPLLGPKSSKPPFVGPRPSFIGPKPSKPGQKPSKPPVVGDKPSKPPLLGDKPNKPPLLGDKPSKPSLLGDKPLKSDQDQNVPKVPHDEQYEKVIENEPMYKQPLAITSGFSKPFPVVYRFPQKEKHNLPKHNGPVTHLRWCVPQYSHLLMSVSMDNTVKIWDCFKNDTPKAKVVNFHEGAIKDAVWSFDGLRIVSCGFDKTARLVDLPTCKELRIYDHPSFVTCIKFNPEMPNMFITGTYNAGIACWDIRTHSVVRKFEVDNIGQILDVQFLPGGSEFLSSCDTVSRDSANRTIMAWDFGSTAVVSNQIYQELFTCPTLKLHPDMSEFIAQSNGDYIAKFSATKPYTMNKRMRFQGHEVKGYPIGCNFCPSGDYLLSGSADGRMYIYNYFSKGFANSKSFVKTIPCYDTALIDVAPHPFLSGIVATCSWGGDITLWE